ncbi:hypothetical protein [Terriglobus sp. TAA 43]|uniref:hypothetical protein n=1 Tax=Terriglobus sp. TAA 43 TaxID=278961 RepID=UPI000648A9AF|nr:hypothetical protein [Terriglobus sp. TAA 43]
MEAVWEFYHSMECNAPREFCWNYWTNIANWDDPPARFRLEGKFEEGSQIITELPEQTLMSVIREVRKGRAAIIEVGLPNASFVFDWSFDDLDGERTHITQRLALYGDNAATFLDQAMVMATTAPDGMRKLVAAMELAISNKRAAVPSQ